MSVAAPPVPEAVAGSGLAPKLLADYTSTVGGLFEAVRDWAAANGRDVKEYWLTPDGSPPEPFAAPFSVLMPKAVPLEPHGVRLEVVFDPVEPQADDLVPGRFVVEVQQIPDPCYGVLEWDGEAWRWYGPDDSRAGCVWTPADLPAMEDELLADSRTIGSLRG